MYVNVGVKYNQGKQDIPSKSALKLAIKENPANVYMYGTSEFNATIPGTLDIMDKGVKYSVCGPNPYTNRKWYAMVEITIDGRIKVT